MIGNKELIKKIRGWIIENALYETTVSPFCWDDGGQMVKRGNKTPHPDWDQKSWDEMLKDDWMPQYIDYEKILDFLDALDSEIILKGDEKHGTI